MALGTETINKEIQEPKKRQTINKAILHQNRIKFHAQTRITSVINQPLTDFLGFVKALIPTAKYRMFQTLFRYPLKSNGVTGTCFDKLSRVFDGRNPAFNYQFMNSEQRDDWEYYRQDVLHEPDVWNTKGWDYFKTEINSILIVDLPAVQDPSDKYPQPYFYWLPIDKVITYDVNKETGIMNWIIFHHGDDEIAVFDSEHYEIYKYQRGANKIGELVVSNPHDLGYCPARFFWNDPLDLRDPDIKSHPLTKELDSLDWFLFFHYSKRHLDLHGAYPIYSGYERDCDYQNKESGETCDGGLLRNKMGLFELDATGALHRCPVCHDKRMIGPGSFVEIPIPSPGVGNDGTNSVPDLRNPVQMLTVDSSSLDYNVSEETRLKDNIISSVVGVNGEIVNTQALNDKQVDASFENESTVLNRIKKGFEAAQQFVDTTVCKLRYGNTFVSAKVNYGTEFYTTSIAELRERYKSAKDGGASEAELDAMHNQIIETEYRHNPTQLQRMFILFELEPYKHLTRNEVIELHEKGLVSAEEMRVKLNFPNFVRRFERENTNILEFGTAIPYVKKIEIINNKLKEYANQYTTGN